MGQMLSLVVTPLTMFSTAVIAVSMEWSWLLYFSFRCGRQGSSFQTCPVLARQAGFARTGSKPPSSAHGLATCLPLLRDCVQAMSQSPDTRLENCHGLVGHPAFDCAPSSCNPGTCAVTGSFAAAPPYRRRFPLVTRASRSLARSHWSVTTSIQFVFIGPQLRFSSHSVAYLRRGSHTQKRRPRGGAFAFTWQTKILQSRLNLKSPCLE